MQQVLIRREHRQARHPELQGQGPSRREPLAGAQQTVEDGPPEPLIDLAVERRAGGAVDGKMQSGHANNLPIGDGDITGVPDIE